MRGYGTQDLLRERHLHAGRRTTTASISSASKPTDGTEASYPAPVSMLVNPVNDTPVATDETRTMSEDGGPLSIDFGALALRRGDFRCQPHL